MELDPGREAAFFDMVLNFIPAELYLPQPDAANAQKQAWKGKYAKNVKGKAPMQDVKEQSKKGKKARYAVDDQPGIVELQKERSELEKAEARASEGADRVVAPAGASRASSVEELRARLRARIEVLQRERKEREEAAERAGEKSERAAKRARKPAADGGAAENGGGDGAGAARKRPRADAGKQQGEDAAPAPAAAGGGSDEPDLSAIDFGKLRFDTASERALQRATKRKKHKQSLPALLSEAEAKQRRLQELKGTEEGAQLQWQDAISRAQGEAVLDDPKLLRKALKRQQKQKEKSTKEWQQRMEEQKASQEARQEKRTENLKARTQRKLESRMQKRGVAPPKKASRAGFEGRKQQFLNKPRPGGNAGGGAAGGAGKAPRA